MSSTAIASNASCCSAPRARGDAHKGSDYDIAVFLRDLTDRWREFHRLADLRTDILADTGFFIEARPFRAG
jgi:predicted nucleotidyltransferase